MPVIYISIAASVFFEVQKFALKADDLALEIVPLGEQFGIFIFIPFEAFFHR